MRLVYFAMGVLLFCLTACREENNSKSSSCSADMAEPATYWRDLPLVVVQYGRDGGFNALDRMPVIRPVAQHVLIIPLVISRDTLNFRYKPAALTSPMLIPCGGQSLRQALSSVEKEGKIADGVFVLAHGYAPITLDPYFTNTAPVQGKKMYVGELPLLDRDIYKKAALIMKRELSGEELVLTGEHDAPFMEGIQGGVLLRNNSVSSPVAWAPEYEKYLPTTIVIFGIQGKSSIKIEMSPEGRELLNKWLEAEDEESFFRDNPRYRDREGCCSGCAARTE